MGEWEGKLFLIEECQLISEGGMMGLEDHPLTTIIVKTNSLIISGCWRIIGSESSRNNGMRKPFGSRKMKMD